MAALKNTLYFMLFAFTIGSLSSCVRDILGFECGKHITLGKLTFADSTKNLYSNWTGKETLIFKDSLGNEQEFSAKLGKTLTFNHSVVIKTLCDSGWLDKQTERFDAESHWVGFSSPNQGYFSLSLYADTIQQKDSFIIYDRFGLEFSGVSFYINSRHGNEKAIPANWQGLGTTNAPKFVADTIITGKAFKNVFYATNDFQKSAIYFQKTNMVIGFKQSGKTWLLDKIK